MKQDEKQEEQIPPAPKRGMSDFRKALLWTAIPIGVLSLISTAGVAVKGMVAAWVVALVMVLIAHRFGNCSCHHGR